MSDTLTPQERDVSNALPKSRPKRHIQMYGIVLLALVFLGIAAYKHLTNASGPRVADRPGAKASDQTPSALALKDIVDKQVGSVAGKAAPGGDPVPGPGSAGVALSGAAVQPALFPGVPSPPVPPAYLPQGAPPPMPGQRPDIARLDVPRTPPMDLSRNLQLEQRAGGPTADMEQRLSDATYLTAKSEVYVVSNAGGRGLAPGRGAADGAQDPAVDAITKLLGKTQPSGSADISKLADPANIRAMLSAGAKQNGEDRVTARNREQEGFSNAARQAKEPLRSTDLPSTTYIAEGTPIPAVLTRAIATNLPGQIEARVVSDVYDSLGRKRLLIPKGSRLVGLYNSNVASGQDRVQVAFTRIIFPTGASIALDSGAATDLSGSAGVPGDVDNHFFRTFGSALAIAFLSYGADRLIAKDVAKQQQQQNGNSVTVLAGNGQTPGTVAAQTFSNISSNVLDRNLSIGPTITVPAGTRINVQVARDLAIDPRVVL